MNPDQSPAEDAKQLTALGSRDTQYTLDRICPEVLETFPNPMKSAVEGHYSIELEFPEFTSLCPKTAQPDFARINIRYTPRERCVETKSLKLYLFSFRSTGCFMERIAITIARDLVDKLDPVHLEVTAYFNARGGITLNPRVTWDGGLRRFI